MSKQRISKIDANNDHDDNSSDDQDSTNPINLTTKLERRRRIEDLNEERRLLKELSEY